MFSIGRKSRLQVETRRPKCAHDFSLTIQHRELPELRWRYRNHDAVAITVDTRATGRDRSGFRQAEQELRLTPGDALLLYTDGLIEGVNAAGEPFGRERLDDALRLAPRRAGPLVNHLVRHYVDFCNGAPELDDRTLLAAVAVP